MALLIPGLGTVTQDGDWLLTEPREVPALGGSCRFVIDGYDRFCSPRCQSRVKAAAHRARKAAS